MGQNPVPTRLIQALNTLLSRAGSQVLLRHYDKSAPVGMDRITGEASSAPPYRYTDLPVEAHRSMSVERPSPNVDVYGYTYYVRGSVRVSNGDVIFDPGHEQFEAGIDPEAENWPSYRITKVEHHRAADQVVYQELVCHVADKRHV